jgi:Arc/MetJ-type ribon-helix-helix transcriptional regulator
MDDAPLKLKQPLAAFVEDQIQSGAYPNRDALVADAIERLKTEVDNDDLKMARLRRIIAEATERLDRGEGQVVDDLDAYFDEMLEEATRS